MPTIKTVLWGEVGESCCCEIGYDRRARGHEGHRDPSNLVVLYTTTPLNDPPNDREIVVVVVIDHHSLQHDHIPDPKRQTHLVNNDEVVAHMMLTPSVTGSQLDRSLSSRPPPQPGPQLPAWKVSASLTPLPPRISPPKTWLGIPGRAGDGA
jgi:hypothetical protein